MNIDLEPLKKLRTRRMEQSFVELQAQRKLLDEWLTNLAQQEQQLLAFQQWRVQHQDYLFASLQNQAFDPQAWLNYRLTLEQLQQQEDDLRAAINKTQQSVAAANTQVETAHKHSTEANVKLEKLKEIMLQLRAAQKPSAELAQ